MRRVSRVGPFAATAVLAAGALAAAAPLPAASAATQTVPPGLSGVQSPVHATPIDAASASTLNPIAIAADQPLRPA